MTVYKRCTGAGDASDEQGEPGCEQDPVDPDRDRRAVRGISEEDARCEEEQNAAGGEAVTEPIQSAREVTSMFATKLQEYGERLKEEAREEGRQEGRQEERRETARAFKEQGVDAAVIAKATGLSPEEIADL